MSDNPSQKTMIGQYVYILFTYSNLENSLGKEQLGKYTKRLIQNAQTQLRLNKLIYFLLTQITLNQ